MQGWPTRIRWVGATLDTSTGASRVETDQGPAYAKLLGNPVGPQALFCEIVGTRAAAWLGLRTFDIAVVNVTTAGIVTYENGSTSEQGPAFVARFEVGTTWGGSGAELASVENSDAFSGLIVLDTWLLNCDRYRAEGEVRRNTRNVFLSEEGAAQGKFKVTAMDHTHCFTCGRQLTKALAHVDRIKDPRLYGAFPEFKEYLTHEHVRHYAKRLLRFSKQNAEALLFGVPEPWEPSAEVRFSADNEGPKQRFGKNAFDDARLTVAKQALEGRLRQEGSHWASPEDLIKFGKKEGNHLLLTQPRVILVEDAKAELEELFQRLVHVEAVP